uniref:Uncharacterized protein n=1 Tax=Cuerna arida TaxID=1464854 RepID=A0A1B6GWK0_9HEMI
MRDRLRERERDNERRRGERDRDHKRLQLKKEVQISFLKVKYSGCALLGGSVLKTVFCPYKMFIKTVLRDAFKVISREFICLQSVSRRFYTGNTHCFSLWLN